jgi:hypothetical protein
MSIIVIFRVNDGSLRGDMMTLPTQVHAINEMVMSTYGSPSTWDVNTLGSLARSGMIEAMDTDMIMHMDPANVC